LIVKEAQLFLRRLIIGNTMAFDSTARLEDLGSLQPEKFGKPGHLLLVFRNFPRACSQKIFLAQISRPVIQDVHGTSFAGIEQAQRCVEQTLNFGIPG
jgi:hypothetical protein